jgi:hypothetical protein
LERLERYVQTGALLDKARGDETRQRTLDRRDVHARRLGRGLDCPRPERDRCEHAQADFVRE